MSERRYRLQQKLSKLLLGFSGGILASGHEAAPQTNPHQMKDITKSTRP